MADPKQASNLKEANSVLQELDALIGILDDPDDASMLELDDVSDLADITDVPTLTAIADKPSKPVNLRPEHLHKHESRMIYEQQNNLPLNFGADHPPANDHNDQQKSQAGVPKGRKTIGAFSAKLESVRKTQSNPASANMNIDTIIDQLVADALPQIERELRRRLKTKIDEYQKLNRD